MPRQVVYAMQPESRYIDQTFDSIGEAHRHYMGGCYPGEWTIYDLYMGPAGIGTDKYGEVSRDDMSSKLQFVRTYRATPATVRGYDY